MRALLLAACLLTTTSSDGPPRKRLRGAVREIGDVQDELVRSEHRARRVERDLDVVLSAFSNGTRAFARRRRRSGGDDGFERALGKRLQEMRDDLTALVRTINATRNELAEARQAVGTTERALESARGAERRSRLAEKIRDGRAAVDYGTGEVRGLVELLSPHELRRLVSQVGSTNVTALEAHLLRESFSQGGGSRKFVKARSRVDPAKLHLDARFLQDVVALSLATAVGGLVAALVHAPHTLGYMVGGVVVGPSGLDLVRNLEQTETVAQFGSIFLLFSHGLMYSHYLDRKKRRVRRKSAPSSPKTSPLKKRQTSFQMSYHSSESEDGDDDEAPRDAAFAWGLGLVLLLGVVFAVLVPAALGGDQSSAERSLVAAAFALSSSSTVLATLKEAKLEGTRFGHTIVEMLSVQDLVLAPLLALPTAVHELRERDQRKHPESSMVMWVAQVAGGYIAAIVVVVLFARRALPRALGALQRIGETGDAQDAKKSATTASFGLCVVGYALAMALLGDRLKLSHEAGALFAGLVLVGTPHVDRAKRAVAPLAALFGGMYVASLGLVVSPRYLQNHASAVVAHVLFVVCVKVAVTAPVVYALGFSKQAAAGAGAVFAQVSEVALFVAARAHELELLARHTYLDVLSTTIVLLAVAPLFIHGLRRVDRRHFLEADREARRGGLVADLAQLPLLIFGRVGLLFRRPARSA